MTKCDNILIAIGSTQKHSYIYNQFTVENMDAILNGSTTKRND